MADSAGHIQRRRKRQRQTVSPWLIVSGVGEEPADWCAESVYSVESKQPVPQGAPGRRRSVGGTALRRGGALPRCS